jgi:chromate transporter
MTTSVETIIPSENNAPQESYLKLFLRFLRFGILAWGGPVVQIGMIKQELVTEERWVSDERFNRVLSIYQALPGPEATELCVHFGMLARGRIGGILAGLGFVLPGFVLMLILTWFYFNFGVNIPSFQAAFYGMQAMVVALIVRAVHRIGGHSLSDKYLWGIAILSFVAYFVGINFLIALVVSGILYMLIKRNLMMFAGILAIVSVLGIVYMGIQTFNALQQAPIASITTVTQSEVSNLTLFGSGLRSGLLTFGGAYTVIPYLRNDAVVVGNWMSDAQFLDGLALSGILPAPLVIFGVFVGYAGNGFIGAILVTIGIFLPAFVLTLVSHRWMERIINNVSLHSFLDGITGGVVGLIAATTITFLPNITRDIPSFLIFAVGLVVLFRWKSKWVTPIVVFGAAIVGLVVFRV